jgi:hypothetical protein
MLCEGTYRFIQLSVLSYFKLFRVKCLASIGSPGICGKYLEDKLPPILLAQPTPPYSKSATQAKGRNGGLWK